MKLGPASWLPLALVLHMILGPARIAQSQPGLHLTISHIDDTTFPSLAVHVTVTDASGLPVTGLGADVFQILQEGVPVERFTCEAVEDSLQPIRVVLVIDTSWSMTEVERSPGGAWATALENTQSAAISFLRSLRPDDRAALVTFSDEAVTHSQLTGDFAALEQAIGGLEARGATAMHDALVAAIAILRDVPPGRKAIVLLADGEDNSSVLTFNDVVNQAQQWSIPIYPIGFGVASRTTLERLARLTGGHAQVQPDSQQLAQAFAEVLQVLRHEYVLRFISNVPADGSAHSLSVTVDHQGEEAQDEATFTARPGDVTVELADLSDGQVVRGDVLLSPHFLAPASIAQVEYHLDGGLLRRVSDPPFSTVWDTTIVEAGEHVLRVTATDAVGNQGSREYRLLVQPAVVVRWLSPQEGASLSGTQRLELEIDSAAQVARVDIYVGETLIGTLTSPPFALEWSAASVPAGSYRLRAVVTDVHQKVGEAEIGVTVRLGTGLLLPLVLGAAVVAGLLIIPLSARRRAKWKAAGAPLRPPGPVAASARLVEVEGLQPGKHWPLGGGDVRIGRKRDENDIAAAGRSASRRHAVIRQVEGSFVLFDLNPANPTLVNGQPTRGQHPLADGDTLQIGESLFRFETRQKDNSE